jgi:hypothetical protein
VYIIIIIIIIIIIKSIPCSQPAARTPISFCTNMSSIVLGASHHAADVARSSAASSDVHLFLFLYFLSQVFTGMPGEASQFPGGPRRLPLGEVMSICSTHHHRCGAENGAEWVRRWRASCCKHVLPGVGCMERAELCVHVTIRMHPLEGPTRGRKDLR